MAVNFNDLADEIASAIAAPKTPEIIGFSKAVLEELTVNGSATYNDFASPHPISGMTESSLANKIATYIGGRGPATTMSIKYAKGIVDHIQNDGFVEYGSKPLNPPTVNPGQEWMNDGTIKSLVGVSMANEIELNIGSPFMSAKLIAKCTAICDHIMNNAEVEVGVIS